jgi:hypothetical protein
MYEAIKEGHSSDETVINSSMQVYLFVYSLPEQFFSYPAAVTITDDGAANLDLYA